MGRSQSSDVVDGTEASRYQLLMDILASDGADGISIERLTAVQASLPIYDLRLPDPKGVNLHRPQDLITMNTAGVLM